MNHTYMQVTHIQSECIHSQLTKIKNSGQVRKIHFITCTSVTAIQLGIFTTKLQIISAYLYKSFQPLHLKLPPSNCRSIQNNGLDTACHCQVCYIMTKLINRYVTSCHNHTKCSGLIWKQRKAYIILTYVNLYSSIHTFSYLACNRHLRQTEDCHAI